MDFNWRRFLAFMPVTVGLALLTVYGGRLMPRYLVHVVVPILFLCFFILFYRSPRWKINYRATSTNRLLVSIIGVVLFSAFLIWLGQRSPLAMRGLVLLMIGGGFTVGAYLRRRSP